MKNPPDLFLCPVCFKTSNSLIICHKQWMVRCRPGKPGDNQRKPLQNQYGRYVSRAPRWYLEALGRIPSWTRLPNQESPEKE